MKTSKIIGFATLQGLIASLLLYKADAGLNFLLLSIWLLSILSISKRINKHTIPVIGSLVLLSISVFYTPQILSIILLVITYTLLVGTSRQWLNNNLFQTFEGLVHSGGWISVLKSSIATNPSKIKSKQLLPFIVPIPFILLFFMLYKVGNPVFDFFTDKLSFDINASFIAIFIIACFYSFPLFIEKSKTWMPYPKSKEISTKPSDLEFSIFKITLLSLSVLLGIFHLLDFTAFVKPSLLNGLSYSQIVHQGFWTLVISIIISLGLILVLSRNKIESNSILNKIILIWLGLNLLLVVSTGIKNMIYIMEYGLTYRRIAVVFALLLSALYIIISFIKTHKNIDFVKFSGMMYKTTLVFTSIFAFVPWNQTITTFNLSPWSKQLDIDYLTSLKNNEIELYKALKTPHLSLTQTQRDTIRIEYNTHHQNHLDNSWYEKNLYWIINSEKYNY